MKRILTVALCLLTAVACGGGGGSDGGVVSGGSTTLTVTYSPANANPGPDSVSLAQGTIQTNLITLDVLVTDTQGVYGAGFDLSYNSSSLTFVGYSPGTILESGGNSPSYQVSAPSPGDLVVGVSRTGQVPGVDVSGTQTLVRLTFQAKGAGTSTMNFTNVHLFDSAGQDISGISWSGGTVTVTAN